MIANSYASAIVRCYCGSVPKARQVRLALQRRFVKLRQRGSHVVFSVSDGTVTFAYHDRVELADRQLRQIARDFGISLEELKKLL